MNQDMTVFLVNYSTAEFEKTLSADNDPLFTDANLVAVSFPRGEYRLIAGRLLRVRDGVPIQEAGGPTQIENTQSGAQVVRDNQPLS